MELKRLEFLFATGKYEEELVLSPKLVILDLHLPKS